ncbi:DUF4112 domain-containing protein [Tundrisphaera sp. TA3]|uniref:DUF4112 domain-containing protein n=1 Tax=Tundrisphaera sp. TA3 TaxID=3435775 RepID=UPI003EBD561C
MPATRPDPDAPLKPDAIYRGSAADFSDIAGPGTRNSEAIGQGLEWLAWLMDRSIPVPGTNFKVGLDAILGLIPGGGDLFAGLIQTGLVLTALKHYRVPKAVAARMAANVLLDIGLGSIPVVGDLFDAGFKANTRNLNLLREVHAIQARGGPIPSAPSVRYLWAIGAILIGALLLMFIGMVAVAALIVKLIWNH